MYAIIRTGGKEYKVAEGDVIEVEKLEGDVGAKIELSDVLLTGDKGKVSVGAPLVKGVKVTAEVIDQKKAPKVNVFKFKRRKNYIRTRGHRQQVTMLKILGIKKAKTEKAEKLAAETKTTEEPVTKAKKTAKKAKEPKAEAKKSTKTTEEPVTKAKKTAKKAKEPKAEAKKSTKTTKKPATKAKKKTEPKKKKSSE
ncbi:MAG: 50S ribosomal protein L21 [bacterium]|nr:50S ribosomal protein L21 [bacterium]